MPVLHDVLADFARAIVRGDAPSRQMGQSYGNYSLDVAIEVYRNNYRGNLHDALAGAYPVVAQLVGGDFFRLLTRRFIERHGSASGNLHHYGSQMADFIASFEPARELAYLPDVARLEWACHCSYFADNASGLDLERLAQVPPERHAELTLRLHPACHIVRSRHPVAAIWQAHQPGADGDFSIAPGSGPCNVLVNRKKGMAQIDELSDAEADWLQAIQAGTPLGEAASATLQRHADFDLEDALLYMLAQGVLCDFSLRQAP